MRDALAGAGPALLPVPEADPVRAEQLTKSLHPGQPIDDDVALVVATSGTTGVPKGAMLTAANLRASVDASLTRLGGPGQWLLALPADHIAGLGVLMRSIAAGTEPVVLDLSAGLSADEFAEATDRLSPGRRYTSLVPNQLIKLLDSEAGRHALTSYDAVLVGGAATPAALVDKCADAGVRLVRSYGMSETCGGCVYDGTPLEGTEIRIDRGRIVLGGVTVAKGYRGLVDEAFADPGWFRTSDLGSIVEGRLVVHGRADGAITTGGLTVVPDVVASILARHPAVRECVVVGRADERLGERVVAVVVLNPGASLDLGSSREHVTESLGSFAAPREVHFVDALPLLGSGKPDLAAIRRMLG